jgi:hypothetical protein
MSVFLRIGIISFHPRRFDQLAFLLPDSNIAKESNVNPTRKGTVMTRAVRLTMVSELRMCDALNLESLGMLQTLENDSFLSRCTQQQRNAYSSKERGGSNQERQRVRERDGSGDWGMSDITKHRWRDASHARKHPVAYAVSTRVENIK